jgi:hypothetical protein
VHWPTKKEEKASAHLKEKVKARPTTPDTLGPQPEDPLMEKGDPEPLTKWDHRPVARTKHRRNRCSARHGTRQRSTARYTPPRHLPTVHLSNQRGWYQGQNKREKAT